MIAKFTYFKESGKYYTSGDLTVKDEAGNNDIRFDGCIYPSDYGKRALELKILPDLAGGFWRYSFIVEAPYPELIIQ